jgi:hypothetical protein
MAGDFEPASQHAATTMVILPPKRARPTCLSQKSTNPRTCSSAGFMLTTGTLATTDARKEPVYADQDHFEGDEAESSSEAYRVLARSLAHRHSPYFKWALARPLRKHPERVHGEEGRRLTRSKGHPASPNAVYGYYVKNIESSGSLRDYKILLHSWNYIFFLRVH